jgi:hypothetical protein
MKKVQRWIGAVVSLAFPVLACGQEFNLSPTYAGEAIALQVTPWGGDPVVLVDTGLAPAMGGQRENSSRDAYPFSGIAVHELYAATLGAASRNHSQASLAFLDATMGSHHVTALWVEAEATATAEFFNVPTSGKCTFAGLTVDGQLVAVNGQANQTLTFPDGYLIINEQSGSSSQHIGTLTVNALHLQVDGAGSMIVGSAKAEVVNEPTLSFEF